MSSEPGRRAPARRAAGLLLLASLLTGCHVYHPVGSERPAAGSDVRVRLTAPGAVEIARVSDEPRRAYEGRLVEANADTVRLSVVQARYGRDFQRTRTFRNELAIPRDFVERFEVREISIWRTSLVSAAAAAAAGFLIYRASGGGGSGGEEPGENGTTTSRVPPGGIEILRFPARVPR